MTDDLSVCPGCGGEADNGHDRCLPPSPYYCTKCMNKPLEEPKLLLYPLDKNKMTPEVRQRLFIKKKDRTIVKEVGDLPIWVKIAITYKALYNMSLEESLKATGRKMGYATLQAYYRSPAAKAWEKGVKEKVFSDEREMALSLIKASALGITLDKLGALQMAVTSNDYKAINIITDSLMDRVDMGGTKKKDHAPATIVVNFSMPPETLKTEGVVIDAEVIDDGDYSINS